MYKLTDTFVLILLIFAVFLSVAYTTLNKLFAVFIYYMRQCKKYEYWWPTDRPTDWPHTFCKNFKWA